MICRHCKSDSFCDMIDLGTSPPSNSYILPDNLNRPEQWYPLKVKVCDTCWLAQTEDFVGAEQLFSEDYAYFSSTSKSWLKHAAEYADHVTRRFELKGDSNVVEIAANDGYLLQYFQKQSIPCYGIEPTRSTASAARAKGIEIIEEFFGATLATTLKSQSRLADLIIANNVLAHVPDINDFTKGISIILKPQGIATFEFPHLLNLITKKQFDTIYHEHYSYLSLTSVNTIFRQYGLEIFDIEELSTHGGSYRLYAQHAKTGNQRSSSAVERTLNKEREHGMKSCSFYYSLQSDALTIKFDLLEFLLSCRRDGKKVMGYGAAAKGNTLLNYAGITSDLIPYIVDRSDSKAGSYTPGGRIPIRSEDVISEDKPDYVLILPWNIKEEIMGQLSYIKEWGGEFVTVIPQLKKYQAGST